jgi:hypothetical protein
VSARYGLPFAVVIAAMSHAATPITVAVVLFPLAVWLGVRATPQTQKEKLS